MNRYIQITVQSAGCRWSVEGGGRPGGGGSSAPAQPAPWDLELLPLPVGAWEWGRGAQEHPIRHLQPPAPRCSRGPSPADLGQEPGSPAGCAGLPAASCPWAGIGQDVPCPAPLPVCAGQRAAEGCLQAGLATRRDWLRGLSCIPGSCARLTPWCGHVRRESAIRLSEVRVLLPRSPGTGPGSGPARTRPAPVGPERNRGPTRLRVDTAWAALAGVRAGPVHPSLPAGSVWRPQARGGLGLGVLAWQVARGVCSHPAARGTGATTLSSAFPPGGTWVPHPHPAPLARPLGRKADGAESAAFLFLCLGPHPWHTDVPRRGGQSELQLPAYIVAATAGSLTH